MADAELLATRASNWERILELTNCVPVRCSRPRCRPFASSTHPAARWCCSFEHDDSFVAKIDRGENSKKSKALVEEVH